MDESVHHPTETPRDLGFESSMPTRSPASDQSSFGSSGLDYSFTPEHDDGSAMVEDPTPGGGGRELRKQLGIMKDFLEQFDLVNAAENNAIVATTVPDGLRSAIRALSDRSRSSWGVYVPRGPGVELGLELPSRFYHVEWIDPRDGKVL